MINNGDLERINVKGVRGRRVRFKAYPSTGVNGAHSKTTKERPMFSPKELMVMQKKFEEMPASERPKICYEHGRRDSLKEIGQVVKMEYNDLDGWMYLDGEIDSDKVKDVEQLIDSGLRGASLCFGINNHCKRLIEVSLVEDPDFDGASIVSYHSGDATAWQQKAFFPATFVEMSEPVMQQLSDGSYVVPHEKHLAPAQDYLSKQGKDPSRVMVVDPSMLESLSEEQRMAFQAGMLGESRLASIREQELEAKRMQDRVGKSYQFIEKLTAGTDIKDDIKEKLGQGIIETPVAGALAEIFDKRLSEKEKEIEQLSEELKKKNQQLRGIAAHAHERIKMHSSGTPVFTFSEMWKKMASEHKSSAASSSSSSSSSLGSSFFAPSEVHAHSAESPRSSVKRVLEEVTPSKEDQRVEEYRKKFCRGELDFWPKATPMTVTDDGMRVFAHSSGVSAEAEVLSITPKSTNAQVMNATIHDIFTGKRDIGISPVELARQNLLFQNPEMFMKIAGTMVDGRVHTNGSSGIIGSASKELPSPHAPTFCRLTPRQREILNQSALKQFGDAY